MPRGQHFFIWRRHKGVPFQHHAVDCGDGMAIHFTDDEGGVATPGLDTSLFAIRCTSIDSITRGGRDTIHIITHSRPLDPDQVVERARGQLGRRGYHVVFDNCEHFATWCVIDRDHSGQVSAACERIGSMTIKAVATGTARAAASIASRKLIRGFSPWLLAADAAQWMTEAGGHHVGLRDPNRRKQASRVFGIGTAVGVGVCGGPAGMVAAGGLWVAGELAGEASRLTYEKLRSRKSLQPMSDQQAGDQPTGDQPTRDGS